MIEFRATTSHGDSSIDSSATPLQKDFLSHWRSYFPSPAQQTFLRRWMSAVEAYGTPLELLCNTTLKKDTFSIEGRDYKCWHWHSSHVEAMAKVRAERAAYISPEQARHEIESQRIKDCYLCQNVNRAIDCENGATSAASNLILRAEKYLVLPNRYGLMPGESLLLPESHDDMQLRSAMQQDVEEGKKTRRIAVEPGKTRGRILSVEDIVAACAVSDELEMAWSRNHPCSGMSIPEHDHFHLWPRRFIPVDLVAEMVGSKDSVSTRLDYNVAENSPISILRLACSDRAALVRAAHEIFLNLERGDRPYITSYLDSQLFICPIKLKDDLCVRVPSLMGMHNINISGDSEKSWEKIAPSLYERNEFPWREYL